MSDLRQALRSLAKSPGLTIGAVAILAVAIGINTAIFSLMYDLAFRSVIPREPSRVVALYTAHKAANRDYRPFSYGEYLALRGATDTFEDVAAADFLIAGTEENGSLRRNLVGVVSDNFFSTVGTSPAAGRFFTPKEARPGAGIPVIVVSYGFWQQYGGRADFIGSTLRVNGRSYTVVGATRRGFSGVSAVLAPDIWAPLGELDRFTELGGNTPQELSLPSTHALSLIARLAPGVSREALAGRLPALSRRLDAAQPPASDVAPRDLQALPPSRFTISDKPAGDQSALPLAGILLGMSACVLLIGCLNLANMLLARSSARAREYAVRMALGANRWRIVRLLLTEGLLLSVGGAALGLLLSHWAIFLLLASLQGQLAHTLGMSLVVDTRPDAIVLGATSIFAGAATLLFCLGPALRASGRNLAEDLKRRGADGAGGGRIHRTFAPRQLLAMAQIGLSFGLVYAACLFARAAAFASGEKLGFDPNGQVVAALDFSLGKFTPAQAKDRVLAAEDRIGRLPGVAAIGIGSLLPYGNIDNPARFAAAQRPGGSPSTRPSPEADSIEVMLASSTRGYLAALGVPLLRGRDFTDAEARGGRSTAAAIIDASAARSLFPNGDPLGRHFHPTGGQADGFPADIEVVGICGSFRHEAFQDGNKPRVFMPLGQVWQSTLYVHARLAAGEPAAVAAVPEVRRILDEIDPNLPETAIGPMSAFMERNLTLWISKLGAAIFGIFGAAALVLAAAGVYGVKAYSVALRTREFGIRIAVGATPADVLALVLSQGILQIVLALSAGLLLSLGTGRALASLLYGVHPGDPVALGGAAVVLAAAALLACYLPARRATKVDPMSALRSE